MNNLDKQFSAGLQNLQMQPKAGGFEAVLKRVSRRRRNRLILILSASLILVLSSISFLYQASNFKHNTASIKLESNNEQPKSLGNQNNISKEESVVKINNSKATIGSENNISVNSNFSTTSNSKAMKGAVARKLKSIFHNKTKQSNPLDIEVIKEKSDGNIIDVLNLNEWDEIALQSRLSLNPFGNNFDLENEFIPVTKFKPYSQKGTIYIDYLLAPEYVNKVLNVKNNQSTDLAKNREKSEKYRSAYGGTIRLTVPIKNGWYAQAGFGYNKFTEFFNYNSQHTLNSLNIDTTIHVIHVPGEPDKYEQHFDTTYTSIKIDNQSKNINSFSQIVLPIGGGFRWNSGNLNVGLNGGIQVMLMSKAKGSILNSTNDGLLNASKNVYKTGLNLGFYAGATLEYGIMPNILFLCEPYFKTNLGGLTSNQYQLNQRNYAFGLNTGLRFKLR